MKEIEYLWDHWKFNADQRLKTFNFFVVLAVFADGGLFSAIEKCVTPLVLTIIGLFIVFLALTFWVLDERSRKFLHLSVPGIKQFELTLEKSSRLFHLDEPNTKNLVRYTVAFRFLFCVQVFLGVAVICYGILASSSDPAQRSRVPALSTCKV